MNRKQHSGVFLMEMIAVVLFFILCAAICIKTFVRADAMSRSAADLNQGVQIAQSVAEVWKAEGREGLVNRLMTRETEDGKEELSMAFDGTGEACGPEAAVYKAKADISQTGRIKVNVTRSGKEIYTLEAAGHGAAIDRNRH